MSPSPSQPQRRLRQQLRHQLRHKIAPLAAALAVALSSATGAHAAPKTLDQGWDKNDLREQFYYTTQGSLLIPYDWFMALEQPTSEDLFSRPGNLTKYGWVMPIEPFSSLNPRGLPVGFAKDDTQWQGLGPWMGLTCAACHTSNVSYKGETYRIDGAPTQADFGGFMVGLGQAVDATLSSAATLDLALSTNAAAPNPLPVDQVVAGISATSGAKFARFAERVHGHPLPPTDLIAFMRQYEGYATPFLGDVRLRTPQLPAGHGRVDALTQIINALSVTDLRQPGNARNPNAPVSYPFLWTTPQQVFVQWNPVAASPIARNLGEALGVFAPAVFDPPVTDLLSLFKNSGNLQNLYELEDWVSVLKPPVWPEQSFGAIDPDKAAKGKVLFDQDCRSCHNMPPFTLTDPKENIVGKQFLTIGRVDFRDIQTDPVYIQSLATRTVSTGALGQIPLPPLPGTGRKGFQPLFSQPTAPGALFFTGSVGETLLASMLRDGLTSPQDILDYNGYRFGPGMKPYSPPTLTSLKAGPLLGIWATGPFLHNGSVPTVYDLLSPPSERPSAFYVGGSELNPQKLGFLSLPSELSAEDRASLSYYDTKLPGNSNSGHVYPAQGLSVSDRYAIIEYLKSARLSAADEALFTGSGHAAPKGSTGHSYPIQPTTGKAKK